MPNDTVRPVVVIAPAWATEANIERLERAGWAVVIGEPNCVSVHALPERPDAS